MAAAKYADTLKFIAHLTDIPVFIVSGHACLCPLSGPCSTEAEEAATNAKAGPLFTLPDDTYMMSWVTPEEIFCDVNSEELLYTNRIRLLQFLYHHSRSDIQREPGVKYSLFDGLQRAVGGTVGDVKMEYPNAKFMFNPSPPVEPEKNPFGVYRIDKGEPVLNNSGSIIKQDERGPSAYWFLKDIVEECLRKEGVSSGVFLLSGCFVRCNEETPQNEIRRLQTHFALLNTYYNSLRPTLTAKEMKSKVMRQFLLRDIGIGHRHARVDIQELLETLKNFDPEEVLEEVHPTNLPKLREGVSAFQANQIREAFSAARPSLGITRSKKAKKWGIPAVKTMKQRILRSKSITRNKSRRRLLGRVAKRSGKVLPAWARNWLRLHKA